MPTADHPYPWPHQHLNRTPVQWDIRNDQLLQKLEQRLEARQTWQGKEQSAARARFS